MKAVWSRAFVAFALPLIAGCQSFSTDLPGGDAAYAIVPAPVIDGNRENYKIGPLDILTIGVFQEPELSRENVQVDASGDLLLPLVGEVRAQGKSARELSDEIAAALGRKYIVDPQVTISVTSSVSQRVTVEGSVNEPGVYQIQGTSTLLEALARARSPTRTARLDQVVVFRSVNGTRMGAVFNVNHIRSGEAADPEVLGGDTVVVGFSAVKAGFRDFLSLAPVLALFRAY